MEHLKLAVDNTFSFVSQETIYGYHETAMNCLKALQDGSGKGSDFLGWLNLPSSISEEELIDLEKTAKSLKSKIDIAVVIGIGGSYLGAKAVNEAMSHQFEHLKKDHENPLLLFAGHNIGEDYLHELIEMLHDRSYALIVISKSGTTTEPAIAFRLLREHLEEKVGKEEARERIIAITDSSKGALRQLANDEGYKSYVIPDDVGGRYSVLTPVGLVPLAIGGFDVRQLVQGAKDMEALCNDAKTPFEQNPAAIYAATRNALYERGKKIEILVNFDNRLHFLSEWWKQLFGESEGKEGKGIFPAACDFSTDLHSMGQYIQEGERTLFETMVSVENQNHTVRIPSDDTNLDKLNYLAGKEIDEVNKKAELGTALAHIDGGVPNIRIEIPKINEYYLGQIMYFFELACGISGYILGINPFDQPGVEAYKKNMFALLDKPGFEEESAKIKERL